MSLSMFESGLYGRLRLQAGSHWHEYVSHPFVQQLAAGTLPQAAFRRYLTQDYLFLVHFARAYALLISKLQNLSEMRAAHTSLSAILNELPLHIRYCQQWGLTESAIMEVEEAAETVNYTRYVLDVGHSGDALDLLTALMPCVAGYAEIGLRLLSDPETVFVNNAYGPWMANYGDENYLAGVQSSLALFEKMACQRGGESRFTQLSSIFTTATRLESAFWQMGLDARS